MRNNFFCAISLCFALCLLPYLCPAASEENEAKPPEKSFTVVEEVWRTPYKSQGKTGTCWSFSTTSFLESEAHRLGRGDLELSPMFTVYHVYLEKAQRDARMHGSGVFKQGGLPHDVVYIMREHGAVPRSDYTGLLQGEENHNHREMYEILRGIQVAVIKAGEKGNLSGKWVGGDLQSRWLEDMRDVLENHLGPIPETINYKGRKMTPKQFADEVLALPFDDYIEVTSYSHLPLYGTGELTLTDNWLHYDNYYNVKLDDFVRTIDHALENGYSLVFDLHTTKALYESCKGYAELDPDLEKSTIDQDTRDTMLENWSTKDQHLVHGVGLAKDETGKRFYYTKDSVGPEQGPYKSIEYLSENFIRAKALFIMVHKDGLPKDVKKKLGIK